MNYLRANAPGAVITLTIRQLNEGASASGIPVWLRQSLMSERDRWKRVRLEGAVGVFVDKGRFLWICFIILVSRTHLRTV
jgi:hypothetical protein